jgi:hypothetical protein
LLEPIARYEPAFEHEFQEEETQAQPAPVKKIPKQAVHASWKTFAGNPDKAGCPGHSSRQTTLASDARRRAVNRGYFGDEEMRGLPTILRSRDDDADVRLLDGAYWLKGCSSPRRVRYAVLLEAEDNKGRFDY